MRQRRTDTKLAHAGRDSQRYDGAVNTPVYRVSTVLHPSLRALEESDARPFDGLSYGRYGTPTHSAFEQAIGELDGAHGAVSTSSGLAAIHIVLTTFLRAGDHVLVTDSVYAPTRRLCDGLLKGQGIETTYYDPLIGGGIRKLLRPNTRLVFVEAPGSLTFEMQDIPAIAEAAHARGAVVAMDNTWATPLHFQALKHGVDVCIHSATKYIVGHADAMLGVISCTRKTLGPVKRAAVSVGNCAGPDEVFLGLRGLRSLGARLRQHAATAMTLCEWLRGRPEVARLSYPPLPEDRGHALWKRDFTGASGLFGVELKPCSKRAVAAMVDELELFGIGYSWGGFESLVIPIQPTRTATRWTPAGPCLRIHAGLEDPQDLIADLKAGFSRLRRSRK